MRDGEKESVGRRESRKRERGEWDKRKEVGSLPLEVMEYGLLERPSSVLIHIANGTAFIREALVSSHPHS